MSTVILFVALPIGMAFLIPMVSRKLKWFPDVSGNITTFILLLLSLKMIGNYGNYYVGGWKPPYGIVLVFDELACFFLIVVNLIAFISTLYAIEYLEKLFTSKLRYYSLFLLMVGGMNGIILTGDFFNLFVFLEISVIAAYALVGFGCQSRELEAAFKYLVIGTVSSLFILFGIGLLYGKFGTLNMADIARFINKTGFDEAVKFAFVLLLVGFLIKSAAIPFHSWLPDAHPSAPTPMSAMLSGVVVKACGIYGLIRITYNIFGFNEFIGNLFIFIGILSMMIGVLLAVTQWDYKRLLAYHTISQVGYIIIGIGIGTPLGILGGLFHLLNHSVFKSLLFLTSGSIEYSTGTRDLQKMGNLVKKMPVTSFASLVGALSISGIPPFNGFWSKLIIILAAIKAGKPAVALWAVIGSILTLASFSKVQKYAFFGKGEKFDEEIYNKCKEVPHLMKMSMVILSILCIFGGLVVINGTECILKPVIKVVSDGVLPYINKILGS
ncbi:MAG: NADH/ubiquinone/plastoquinone (complex I) [Candidatus Omnitrophota bacterium]|nr:MAG: NADH/ubiquinone/plastoquinone (complex I) [Candidatus Omnitrophota bacterium]